MSYSSSPTLEGRIRDWLKLSPEDRADYLDQRRELRQEQEDRSVVRTLLVASKTRRQP